MHRGNDQVSYILQGWCYSPPISFPLPFSYCQPLFPLVLHAYLQNDDGNYDDLQGLTWICPPDRCRALWHAPSCCCWLGGFQHRGQWATLRSEGRCRAHFGYPHTHKSLVGDKRDIFELHSHLCFVKPLQLLLFNQLLCLLLQLPSLSDSPFCL